MVEKSSLSCLSRRFLLQHFSGLEEAVYRNIQACKELAQTTRTAYGPNGNGQILAVRDVV